MKETATDQKFTLRKAFVIALLAALLCFGCAVQPGLAEAAEGSDNEEVNIFVSAGVDEYTEEEALAATDQEIGAFVATEEEPSASGEPELFDQDDEYAVSELAYSTSRYLITRVQGKNSQSDARRVLDLINAKRRSAGVATLTWDTSLERSAMQRAAEISILFDHTRPNGNRYLTANAGTRINGENIAWTGSSNATKVHNAWANSPGHNRNMLDRSYKSVGIACFDGYWVECFSTSRGSGMTTSANNSTGSYSVELAPSYFNRVFRDVDPSAWYVKDGYLAFVCNNKIMTGYSNASSFGPNNSITRGQVAVILHRIRFGPYANNNVSTRFRDVPSGMYYSAAVKWASENNIITGYSGTGLFKPNSPVTREELATMVARYAKVFGGKNISSASSAKFYKLQGNQNVSYWAKESMIWCVDKGIITGVDNRYLRPNDSATRASMAKIITVTLRNVL